MFADVCQVTLKTLKIDLSLCSGYRSLAWSRGLPSSEENYKLKNAFFFQQQNEHFQGFKILLSLLKLIEVLDNTIKQSYDLTIKN